MTDLHPVDEYSGMAEMGQYAFYYLHVGQAQEDMYGEIEAPARPTTEYGRMASLSPSGRCVTVTTGTEEGSSLKVTFLIYEAEPAPLPGEWTARDEFACVADDLPADFVTAMSNECMFAPPLPPDHLFDRPGEDAPYRWRARLLVADFEVEEHIFQFWPE